MRRLQPPREPVTMNFDGRPVVAERGEPVAASLLAAGYLVLARSPKFHRPRGPSCFRAACDGCLARVDGCPNVMTCRVPAEAGTTIETQNVVGSRETDLLRMTDWFFPEGLNHHELFAGVPGLQQVMQASARRVAGLGKLPSSPSPPRTASRRSADVLVIGAGPAGMAAAMAMAQQGRRVEVVEEDLVWGGGLRALGGKALDGWHPLMTSFRDALDRGAIALLTRTFAAGLYGDDLLLAGPDGVELMRAAILVVAAGAHDGVLAFEGNDLPGVLSVRAAGRLASLGISVGEEVVAVVAPGGGPFGEAFVQGNPSARLVRGTPVRAGGSRRVGEALIATQQGERQFRCDTLVIDAPRAPAYELCAQAGAALSPQLASDEGGYLVVAPGGRIRKGVFAIGEVVGAPLEPSRILREATALAAAG